MTKKQSVVFFLAGIALVFMAGCSGKHLNVHDDQSLSLQGCYPLPNCVSSTTWILYNRTPAFQIAIAGDEAWKQIKAVIAAMPRTKIVEVTDVYLHAKCKSRIFGFVDNLELLRHKEADTISVRSSSMIAIFDFFVNHYRVYQLRSNLRRLGVIN